MGPAPPAPLALLSRNLLPSPTEREDVSRETSISRTHIKGAGFNFAGEIGDVVGHTAVLLQFGNDGAGDGEGLAHAYAGLERQAKVKHLGGAYEFYGDDLIGLLQDTQHFVGAGSSHTIEVFHAGAGGNGVDTGGMSQNFDFIGQG